MTTNTHLFSLNTILVLSTLVLSITSVILFCLYKNMDIPIRSIIVGSLIVILLPIIHFYNHRPDKLLEYPDKLLKDIIWIGVVLIIILPLCLTDYLNWTDEAKMNYSIADCGLIFTSALSVVFILKTMRLQRKQLNESNTLTKHMRDNEVLSMINHFFSNDMKICRDESSKLKDRLKSSSRDAAVVMLEYAFQRQIYDDTSTNSEWHIFRKSPDYDQYAAFIRIIRFFDIISHTSLSDVTAHALHSYYVWWRSFFIDVIHIYNQVWNNSIPSARQLSFKPNWIETVNRLDSMLKKYNLPVE